MAEADLITRQIKQLDSLAEIPDGAELAMQGDEGPAGRFPVDPLLARENHTGEQGISTIAGLADELAGKAPATVIQSGDDAQAETVQTAIRRHVYVDQFKTVLDADDTACIGRAYDAGHRHLLLEGRTYAISDDIVFLAPTWIEGKSRRLSRIRQTNNAKGGLNFDYPVLVQGGGIRNLSIEAGAGWLESGFQGSGATGIGLRVANSNGAFSAENFGIHNFDTGISCLGSFYPEFTKFQVLYAKTDGVLLSKSGATVGAGASFAKGKISNFGYADTNTASYGIRITASGGDFFEGLDVTAFNKGISLQATATENVLYCFFTTVLADTCLTNNWEFDATLGKIWTISLTNCWGSYSTNGAGAVFKGANLDGVKWVGGAIRENGTHGAHLMSGKGVQFVGVEIASNSKLTANTYNGVHVDAGVSGWACIGCVIGNVASTLTGQLNNIAIAAGASQNFRIIGNDLNNPGAGGVGISNGSSSSNYEILGNLPLQAAGGNTSGSVALTGGSVTAPAAGLTGYLGPGGFVGGVNDSPWMVNKPGVVTKFYVAVVAAPGAGETFTYTVMKNAVATSMTGTISGAGSFSVSVTTNAFTVAPDDALSLRLVTSNGAVATKHRFYISLEP